MPKKNRRKTAFYLRRKPKPEYDIQLLRSPSLPLGKRFETLEDACNYSEYSEHKLDSTCQSDELADRLNECRTSDQRCGQAYCPICARPFRVWFIGELLRIADDIGPAPVHIMTILLEEAPYDKINSLNLKGYDAALRKRLGRNGLNDAAVIGGYENLYRAKSKTWVLHVNLVVIGGTNEAIARFGATFFSSDIAKPVLVQKLKLEDRPTQLSYILKFTTYHRPFVQRGFEKVRQYP